MVMIITQAVNTKHIASLRTSYSNKSKHPEENIVLLNMRVKDRYILFGRLYQN